MNSNKTVVAYFVEIENYTLTTSISPASSGSVNPSFGDFAPGTQVEITANPSFGYLFDHWSGTPAVSGTVNTITVTMDSDRSVTAHFRSGYTLTTYINGLGVVTPMSGTYDAGTVVSLVATPGIGWLFGNWIGAASGSQNPLQLTMNSNKVLTAHFLAPYTLTTSALPPEGGSVAPPTGTFHEGTNLSVIATANPDWHFVEWHGDVTGYSDPSPLLINGNKSVTAEFALNDNSTAIFFPYETIDLVECTEPQNLTVLIEERGGTRYEHVDVYLTGQFSESGYMGRLFDVTTAIGGWVMLGWDPGVTTPRNIPIQVFQDSVYQDPVVCNMWLVYFDQQRGVYLDEPYSIPVRIIDDDPVPVNFTVMPENAGTVEITPPGDHYQDEQVTLTATPAPGYQFVEWQGDVTGATNPAENYVLDFSKDITAVFEPATIVISEVLSVNSTGIVDFEGERQPWIELWNPNDSAVTLMGWSFTHEDSLGFTSNWTIPDTTIGADAYMVIFASGKDLVDQQSGEMHTDFVLDSGGGRLSLKNNEGISIWSIDSHYPTIPSDYSYGYYTGGMKTTSGVYTFGYIPTPGGDFLMPSDLSNRQLGIAGLGANGGLDDQAEINRAMHYPAWGAAKDGETILEILKLSSADGSVLDTIATFTHGWPCGMILDTDQGFYDEDCFTGVDGASSLQELEDIVQTYPEVIRFEQFYSRFFLQSCRTGAYFFAWKLSKITHGVVYAPVGACSPQIIGNQETGWFWSDPPTTPVYLGQDGPPVEIPLQHWVANGTWRKFLNGGEIVDPWFSDDLVEVPEYQNGRNRVRCW